MSAGDSLGVHFAVVTVDPGHGRQPPRWYAWCETCSRSSRGYPDRATARDLVACHVIEPVDVRLEEDLEPEEVRARATTLLGTPTVWL